MSGGFTCAGAWLRSTVDPDETSGGLGAGALAVGGLIVELLGASLHPGATLVCSLSPPDLHLGQVHSASSLNRGEPACRCNLLLAVLRTMTAKS